MQRLKTQRRILLFLTLLLLLAVPTSVALAAPATDKIVNADDVIRNDIVLFDENFELADGGRVTGDVIIFNGDAHIAGTVNGDVVLFNGNLTTETTASLNGECVLFNGTASGEGSSSISCTNMNVMLPDGVLNFVEQWDTDTDFAPMPPIEMERPSFFSQFVGGTAAAIARSLLFGLLAFAAASLIPQPMMRIEEAMRKKPIASGAVGLLTAFSMPFVVLLIALISIPLILVFCVGLLGYPLIAAMLLGMVAAGFLGWFTVGNIVGEFLAEKLNLKNRTQPVTAALGTVAITFLIGFMEAMPFVIGESLIWVAIMAVGLGATALTKFGTRAYPIIAAPPLNQDKITAVLKTLPDKSDIDN